MVKIISDTCTLYTPADAQKMDTYIAPLHVNIDERSYREYVDLESADLLRMIKEGAIPQTSQPSLGDKIAIYEKLKDTEVIDITIAKGLSGAYDTALMAKEQIACENITVFNSKTLCGPQRYLFDEALKMAYDGQSKEAILRMLERSAATDVSFLVPLDFDFLKRGGRISKAAAGIGTFLKLWICMIKSDDGTCLEKFAVNRTFKGLMRAVLAELKKRGVDGTYRFSITHAANKELALKMKEALTVEIEKAVIDIFDLSPVFITQGGPGCCALQAIKIQR